MEFVSRRQTTLDDALGRFSIFSAYHAQLLFFIGLTYVSNSVFSDNYIFAVEEVSYRCADADFVNDTCGTINSTMCTEFIYNNPYSVVAEFQLACQDWKRTLVGTMHGFGNMIGLLLAEPLSNRIGRKQTIIITGVVGGIFGLSRTFVTSYWLYILLEFLEAAFGDTFWPAYILNIEIVSTAKRIPYYMIASLGFGVGGLYMSLIAWILPDWRNFTRVIYSPALFFFIYLYLIDESPKWLITNGIKYKAVKIIQKIAQRNKVKVDQTSLDNLSCEVERVEKFSTALKNTLSSKSLIKRLIVCIIWWITSTLVNTGMSITSVSLPGNKYINYALVKLIEFPGRFIAMCLLMKCKRKFPLICSFLIAGVFCIGQAFLPNDLTWLSIIMFMAGKLMASFYFAIAYIYTSELFPTYTRNSMYAICSSLGRIGSILAPQAPLLVTYWDSLPALVFGAMSILTGLVTFFVPDITNASLPDTAKDAEAIGTRKSDKKKRNLTINYMLPSDTVEINKEPGVINQGYDSNTDC